jgi:hypothetical protein
MLAAFIINWYDIWQFITKIISIMKNIQKQPSGMNSGTEQQGDNFTESVKNKIPGEKAEEELNKAEATKKIDGLQHKTDRGE